MRCKTRGVKQVKQELILFYMLVYCEKEALEPNPHQVYSAETPIILFLGSGWGGNLGAQSTAGSQLNIAHAFSQLFFSRA